MLHNNLSTKQPKTINRNLQNKWLLDNLFDSHGNYIYCFSCIKKILNISGKRLCRLREIKRDQAKTPKIKVRKDQILPEQKFDRINEPSASEADRPENWKRRSLTYEFNRTLEGDKRISRKNPNAPFPVIFTFQADRFYRPQVWIYGRMACVCLRRQLESGSFLSSTMVDSTPKKVLLRSPTVFGK